MTSAILESRPWSVRRWWTAIAIVFVVQVALVFVLEEDRPSVKPRKTSAAPTFRLAGGRSAELLSLEDPTLFALPHRRGFSGNAWRKIPSPGFPPAEWPEPARFLSPRVQEWGTAFRNFVQTTAPPAFATIPTLEPEVSVPEDLPILPSSASSRLRIEGNLAGRRLLSPALLQSWTNTDLLTNSLVQVLVDTRGNTVSAVLLRRGTIRSAEQDEADQLALSLAKTARFDSTPAEGPTAAKDPSSGLSIGTLIFEWQTIPGPSTNALLIAP